MSGARLGVATQRWRERQQRWRPPDDRPLETDRYDVVEIAESAAAEFIERHHYSRALPSTSYRYGLLDHRACGRGELVGVATLGVPMSRAVLTNAFPTLVPYHESLEFNRLVLLDEVPNNGESWFCARVFQAAARQGVRGLVTFADPVPRWLTVSTEPPRLIKPGHVGIVYQSLNFTYTGRATRRTLTVLPDASVLSARSIAKVTARDRGHRGVIARLVALGAPAPDPDAELKVWLAGALERIGARRIRHPGNHRYLLRIGSRTQRTRTQIGFSVETFPKPSQQLTIA